MKKRRIIMKRIAALLLCILILPVLQSGCGPDSSRLSELPDPDPATGSGIASSAGIADNIPSSAADDQLLAELMHSIETAEISHANIYTDGMMYDDPRSVHVSQELLLKIGDLIFRGNPKRLEPPPLGLKNAHGDIGVEYGYDDDQYALIQLSSGPDEFPDKTLMWLQLSEETGSYTLESSVYDEIRLIVAAWTFDKELVLVGDFIRYVPMRANTSHFGLTDVLEIGGKLLFLWKKWNVGNGGNDYWLESVDIKTGAAETVWEYRNPLVSEDFKLEHTHYDRFDYRIKSARQAIYRNSGDAAVSLVYKAPTEAGGDSRGLSSDKDPENGDSREPAFSIDPETGNPRGLSFDIDPETGRLAYSNAGGVFAGYKGNMIKVLDNQELGKNDLDSTELYMFYTEVHLLNGGKRLAAQIINLASQSGLHALALVDLDTGRSTTFENLFSAMIAEVRYVDDINIAAIAMNQVTLINAESKLTRLLPIDDRASTYNFDTCVELRQTKNETGLLCGPLVAYSLNTPKQVKELLTVSGENAWLEQVTRNYAVLRCIDSVDAFIAIVPIYNQQY